MVKMIVSGFAGLTAGLRGILLQHDALTDLEILELVGAPAPEVFPVGLTRSVFVVKVLARDDEAVEQELEQRSGRLLGDDLHGIGIDRDHFLDRRDVLLLLALRIGANPLERKDHVCGGEFLAVVLALEAVLEMKEPDVWIGLVDLPALRQHADIVGLGEIVDAETTQHLAPDAIGQRNTVSIGIVARNRLGDADGHLTASRCGAGACAQCRGRRHCGGERDCMQIPFHRDLLHGPRSLLHRDIGAKNSFIRVRLERNLVGNAVKRVDAPKKESGKFVLNGVERLQQQ